MTFLIYANPLEGTTTANGTFTMLIKYGPTTDPITFSAELNRQDISSLFHPIQVIAESIELDLEPGRNVLLLIIDGIRDDGRTATERDILVFLNAAITTEPLSLASTESVNGTSTEPINGTSTEPINGTSTEPVNATSTEPSEEKPGKGTPPQDPGSPEGKGKPN